MIGKSLPWKCLSPLRCRCHEKCLFASGFRCCARVGRCSYSESFMCLCVSRQRWHSEVHHNWNVRMPFPRKWKLAARQASCDECWEEGEGGRGGEIAHKKKEMVKYEMMTRKTCNTLKLTSVVRRELWLAQTGGYVDACWKMGKLVGSLTPMV